MTKEDKKNAYLYCKFRDEQFALYDEYAKRHGMLMKTLLVANVLYYAKDGMTQTEICRRTFQSKQTVNLIVKNFLAESYVTVTETPENRMSNRNRQCICGATEKKQVLRKESYTRTRTLKKWKEYSVRCPIICGETEEKVKCLCGCGKSEVNPQFFALVMRTCW